jgi:uncharacterized membrane protein (UPF0127 family)
VEVVQTDASRVRGLSGRSDLGTLQGMLFVFDTVDRHQIWMKDMQFPIDAIWIDESLTIVHIDRNLLPASYPQIYKSPVPVKYLIETEAHYADTFNIRIGQTVTLPPLD